MAYHPKMRHQLEADGLIDTKKEVVKAPAKTDPRYDEKSARKKIIEEKPKKKVVKEYFKSKIETKQEQDEEDD